MHRRGLIDRISQTRNGIAWIFTAWIYDPYDYDSSIDWPVFTERIAKINGIGRVFTQRYKICTNFNTYQIEMKK